MKEFYTVGEIGKIFNLPTATLRYYDDIGLLRPWMSGENGYRYYSKAQFEIISTIVLMRSLGTPLKRMLSILNASDASGIKAELNRYTSEIDRKIEELESLKVRAVQLDKDIDNACYSDRVEIITVPECWLMTKSFGEEDELDIDEILSANRQASKWARTASIISTILPSNLEKGSFHIYERYGYMSENPCPISTEYCERIEKRLCACCNVQIHSVEHFEADAAYSGMMSFIEENGYTVTGPAIERNVLSLYGEEAKNPIMFFKIYIPVSKVDTTKKGTL